MKNYLFSPFLLTMLGAMAIMTSCNKDKDDDPATAINLYFTYWDGNTVNKIDLVNTPNAVTELFGPTDGVAAPSGIALTSDGYLIVLEEEGNRIIKMQKDGAGDIVVLYDATDGVSEPTAVAMDNSNGAIYWCNSGTDQVMKGSDDGLTTPVAMYSGADVIGYAYGIAIDKSLGKLYTGDFYEGIKVGNLDGSGTTEVLWDATNYTEMGYPSNIFVDGKHGRIYWADESTDQIVEANLDGTGTPVVLFDDSDGVSRADAIAVDYNAKKIYWSETTSNVIARGNLDGTGTREVLVDEVESYAMVLEIK
jgi:hypothetical protein